MMPFFDPKMRIMLVGMRSAVGAWMVALSLGASAHYVPQTSYRADMYTLTVEGGRPVRWLVK